MEDNKSEKGAQGSIKGKVFIKQTSIAGKIKISTNSKSPKGNLLKYSFSEN